MSSDINVKELKQLLRQREEDGILTFVSGMMLGLLGGAVIGLLVAPKSGQALRSGTYKALSKLPDRVNEAEVRTKDLIDKTRHKVENQMGKVRKEREADRMAKVKRAEELASGYEFN